MTLLLDVITADHDHDRNSYCPAVLDPETGLRCLRPSAEEPPNPTLLVYPVSGFKLSHSDTQIAELSNKLFAELDRYMKNTRGVFGGKVSKFLSKLIERKKTDLICECVKNLSDLKAGDIFSILRYFLVRKDAYLTMSGVVKEWERQAVKASDRASDKTLKRDKLVLAKAFAVLLMAAYDEFIDSELCLHYLFKTMSVDELVLMSAISKLNGKEIMALIRYLGKWLRKYDKFPQAFSLTKDSFVSGPMACNWLPKTEDVINCLGLVIDEHFSTLLLHQEFHDEMRALDGLVGSLVLDARLCCSLTNVVEILKSSK